MTRFAFNFTKFSLFPISSNFLEIRYGLNFSPESFRKLVKMQFIRRGTDPRTIDPNFLVIHSRIRDGGLSRPTIRSTIRLSVVKRRWLSRHRFCGKPSGRRGGRGRESVREGRRKRRRGRESDRYAADEGEGEGERRGDVGREEGNGAKEEKRGWREREREKLVSKGERRG